MRRVFAMSRVHDAVLVGAFVLLKLSILAWDIAIGKSFLSYETVGLKGSMRIA